MFKGEEGAAAQVWRTAKSCIEKLVVVSMLGYRVGTMVWGACGMRQVLLRLVVVS